MPTTNGQLYAMMYGGNNTDVVSLYMSALSSNPQIDQGALSRKIAQLETIQARYARNLKESRTKGGQKKQLYRDLEKLRIESRTIRSDLLRYEQANRRLQKEGLGDKITVAKLRKKADEEIDKKYELTPGSLKEIAELEKNIEIQLTGDQALSNLQRILVDSSFIQGLSKEGKIAFLRELYPKIENIRKRKASAGLPSFPIALQNITGELVVEALLEEVVGEEVLTGPELTERIEREKEEAKAVYAGLLDDEEINLATAGPQFRAQQKRQRELEKEIRKVQEGIGYTASDRVEALMQDENLQGYLADVRDDFLLNQSAGEYNVEEAEKKRAELKRIAEVEPLLIGEEDQSFLDPRFVEREYRLRKALTENLQPTQTENPMAFLLGAPRLTPFSPAGEVQNFIADLKSGQMKEELKAQLIAEQNPESAFGRAWAQAPPDQRVLMSLIPSAAIKAQGDMKAKTRMEKKAQQAIDVAGGARTMDAANIMRLAKDVSNDKEDQTEFIRFVLASQRKNEVAPKEITTEMSKAMTEELEGAPTWDARITPQQPEEIVEAKAEFVPGEDITGTPNPERQAALDMLSNDMVPNQMQKFSDLSNFDVPF